MRNIHDFRVKCETGIQQNLFVKRADERMNSYLYEAALSDITLRVVKYYNESYRYYRMREHKHPAFEIMYVKQGKCRITCTAPDTLIRDEVVLEKDQYIYIYSNIDHNLFIDRDTGCRLLNVEIETPPCRGQDAIGFLSQSESLTAFVARKPAYEVIKDNGTMYDILRCLHDKLYEREEREDSDAATDIFLLSARLLLETAARSLSGCADGSYAGMYVKMAKHYIQEHYDNAEEISVSKIAAYVKLSPAYLQRLFHTETGDTIIAYVNQLRLKKAKHLLLKTDFPLVEIAIDTGLGSRQRLTQLFVTSEGISPGKYRSIHRDREFEQD